VTGSSRISGAQDVLVVTDAAWVLDDLRAAVGDAEVTLRSVRAGVDVLPAVQAKLPDLVVLDLQIGNMGGMATCMHLRLEEGAGRLDPVPILMLLDRRPDVFLAKRADADGWLLKPLDAIRTRKAVHALLRGERFEDGSQAPTATVTALTVG
jgi:DNA-binding response OmpR family regulator